MAKTHVRELYPERQQVLAYVRENGGGGVKDVADGLGKDYGAVAKLLRKLKNDGELVQPEYGKYAMPSEEEEPEPA
jgi:DNA-binding MarR family transcriptional regulator